MNTVDLISEKDILKDRNKTLSEKERIQQQYRRIRSILRQSGFGVIIFGLWSIIRVVLQAFFNNGTKVENEATPTITAGGAEIPVDAGWIVVAVLIAIFGFLIVEVGLRLFVGFSARSEAMGKKKSIAYIIVAGILIPFYAFSAVYNIMTMNFLDGYVIDMIITIILDVSSLIALIELFVSGIRLRGLRKKYGEV